MDRVLTAEDESKSVIDANGDHLGTVSNVEDGVAIVEPSDDVSPSAAVALGWGNDADRHRLPNTSIESVTESGIHLRSNL